MARSLLVSSTAAESRDLFDFLTLSLAFDLD